MLKEAENPGGEEIVELGLNLANMRSKMMVLLYFVHFMTIFE